MELMGPQEMDKPRGRPRSDRDDVTVKVDRAVIEKARHLAMRRRVTLAELLTEILKGPVEKAYAQDVKQMALEAKGN